MKLFALCTLFLLLNVTVQGQDLDKKEVLSLLVQEGPQAALTRLGAYDKTAYDFGMDLIYEDSSEHALQWFEQLAIYTNDVKYLFGKAWTHWYRSEVQDALKDANFVLLKQPPAEIEARCRYMLGMIFLNTGENAAARDSFDQAQNLYDTLGKRGGKFLCMTGLAAAAIRQQDFEQVVPYLDEAHSLNQTLDSPYSMGWLYELYAEYYFQQADYAKALDYGRQSISEFKGEKNRGAWREMEVKTSLYAILNGDLEAGYRMARELDKYAAAEKNEKLAHYNNITWILLYRCQGTLDYSQMVEKVRGWGQANRQQDLLGLLQFIEAVPCPEFAPDQ